MIYLNYAALCPTLAEAEEEVERTLAEFKRYLYSEAGIEWYLARFVIAGKKSVPCCT